MDLFWSLLPGPRSFVSDLVADIDSGKDVVVAWPRHTRGGLREAVRARLTDDRNWHRLRPDRGETPLALLFREFAPDIREDTRDLSAMLRERSLGGAIIWVEGIEESDWPLWRDFLEHHAATIRQQHPSEIVRIVVSLPAPRAEKLIQEDVSLVERRFAGRVGFIDALLFSIEVHKSRDATALRKALSAAITAHICLWDTEACERLASSPLKDLVRPEALFAELRKERGWSDIPASSHEAWALGLVDTVDGARRRHPAVLSGPALIAEFDARVWKAEVMVLFPYLEEARLHALRAYEPLLKTPWRSRSDELVEKPSGLELGHILQQMEGRQNRGLSEIRALKSVRDRLAHIEPLDEALLRRVVGMPVDAAAIFS